MSRPVQTFFDEAYLPLLRSAALGDYDSVMASQSGEALTKPGLGGRQRIRLDLPASDGEKQTIFLKRCPRCARATAEWRAIQQVREAGVPTMSAVAMGVGPAGGFVIVTCVPGYSLERGMDDLLERRGGDRSAMTGLAEGLGGLIGTLHRAGLAHRDFYSCHVFCHEREGRFDLYLIDLARVFRPRWRRWRWWAKDLSQLKFSLPQAWIDTHWPALLAAYQAACARELPPRVAATIERRVLALRRRQPKAGAPAEKR
jgi:tRNA A-37 threonylcarbamoyl transferase component Bud32